MYKCLVQLLPGGKAKDFFVLTREQLLNSMETDNSLYECLPQSDIIRIFFDVDWPHEKPVSDFIEELKCIGGEWAICDGSRPGKTSYHILSKTYKCSFSRLRALVRDLGPWFDRSVYLPINGCSYLRLPNQSKKNINKEGAPMTIIQGELADFIVTETETLRSFH
jgi:hypothetical protein